MTSVRSDTPRSKFDGQRGFVLVSVLWLLAALASLASVYSAYSIQTAAASRSPLDRLAADAAIRAGIEMAAFHALSAAPANRLPHGDLSFSLGDARIFVRYVSEASRIDLNAAPKELLSGLFQALGETPAKASSCAERVVGSREPRADPNAADPEGDAYRQAGLSYGPLRRPFDDTYELTLVPGCRPGLAERAIPFLTVLSNRAEVEALDAPFQVLAALPEIPPEALNDLLKARTTDARLVASLIQRLGPSAKYTTLELGKTIRVSVEVVLPSRRRPVTAEAVIRLQDDAEVPFDVLYWSDDFDGPLSRG